MKLIVCDIDNTLLKMGETKFKKEVIDTINKLLLEGHAFCLASGRPFLGIKKYLDIFVPGKKFAICGNGAVVYDYNHNLINETAMKLQDFYELYDKYYRDDITFYAYDDKNNLLVFKEDKYTDYEVQENKIIKVFDINNRDNFDKNLKIHKIMFACDESINKNLKLSDEELKRFSTSRSSSYYFEILANNASKGHQVEKLRSYLGIDRNEVFTFGDNTNDLTMIEMFNGVAVNNAVDEVKTKAKYITKSVEEIGFVYAIYEILKILEK
mgnify:CR=1 FL=1